jgi:glycosyltransferase involved in cell wall biosynthesis
MIVTLHGSVEPIPDRHMRRKLRNIVYLARRKSVWKEATLFLCVSKFMRNVAIAAGYPSEKLRVHYIGIDVEKFSPTLEPRDQNLVLFVGRLAEKKGCKYLIQAMAEVQRMRPATELLIVGDGPERDALRAEATRLGVLCEFVGYGSTEDILKLLRTARVFCGPSIAARDSNSEGLGMVFAEAQAVGLPVVSFVHGGIPEVVRHGETGLLAPEKDVQLLTRYLLRYLEDDVFWSKCSRAGIEWIRTQFDLRRQTVELEEIYDAALRAVNDAHPTSIGE